MNESQNISKHELELYVAEEWITPHITATQKNLCRGSRQQIREWI